jgi:hypothetical protein
MVALARNLNLIGSRFLTGLTAVFVTRLRQAPAWQMRTLVLLICRHHSYCSPFPTAVFIIVVAGLLWWAHFPPLQTVDLLSDGPPLFSFRIYLRFIIQPINVPAVTPIAKVVATVSTGWRWMR